MQILHLLAVFQAQLIDLKFSVCFLQFELVLVHLFQVAELHCGLVGEGAQLGLQLFLRQARDVQLLSALEKFVLTVFELVEEKTVLAAEAVDFGLALFEHELLACELLLARVVEALELALVLAFLIELQNGQLSFVLVLEFIILGLEVGVLLTVFACLVLEVVYGIVFYPDYLLNSGVLQREVITLHQGTV